MRLIFNMLLVYLFLHAFLYVDATKNSSSNESLTDFKPSSPASVNIRTNHSDKSIEQQWNFVESRFKDMMRGLVKAVMPMLISSASTMNISKNCTRDVMVLLRGVRDIKYWAMRFLDSSGKSLDGVLNGRLSALGDYDECVKTFVYKERPNKEKTILLQGKYCTINLKPTLPAKKQFYEWNDPPDELKNFSTRETVFGEMAKYANLFHFLSLRFGVCVPSGCSTDDMQQIATSVGHSLQIKAEVSRCEVKMENEFSTLTISVITCYSFLGFLVLIGSAVDMCAYYTKSNYKNKWLRVLLAFSFIANFKKVINVKTGSKSLSCLNGIRFLGMSWIILGHSYFLLDFQVFAIGDGDVQSALKTIGGDFAFQPILNGQIAVDTFFFISGLLASYVTIQYVKLQKKEFSIMFYLVHRLLRILPVYICVIAFAVVIYSTGSGPLWHDLIYRYVQPCYENWWKNILFINNWYHVNDICVLHSWYISADMQLHAIGLIILISFLRKPLLGTALSIFGILMSAVISGFVMYSYNYPPTGVLLYPDPQQLNDVIANFHIKTFAHASPFFIGMLVGYLLVANMSLKITKGLWMIGWCCAITCNMAVVYGALEWNSGRAPTRLESILYASLKGIAWAAGLAWMIVCCATGQGGVINYILSWKMWIPVGRLTYSAFLIHPIIQIMVLGSLKSSQLLQHQLLVWIFLGHLCVTYAVAFVCTMVAESPFMELEKILFGRNDSKKKESDMSFGSKNKTDLKSMKNDGNAIIISISKVQNDEILKQRKQDPN